MIADAIDAMAAAGSTREAASLVRNTERAARGRPRPYAKAIALRGKGLLSAEDDLPAASEPRRAASREVTDPACRTRRARTLLVLGSVQRRIGKQRAAARSNLEGAVQLFDRIGAAPWAARATEEAAMIGGRQRARELTDAECRVAKLAAAGLSTKEIAAILFLAERTVDGHRQRVPQARDPQSDGALAPLPGRRPVRAGSTRYRASVRYLTDRRPHP